MSPDKTTQISHKRHLEGVVVRRSGDKTVSVQVVHSLRHPVYKKSIKRTKKFLAHDPNNSCQVGDVVTIEESRPLSRHKRWMVIKTQTAK